MSDDSRAHQHRVGAVLLILLALLVVAVPYATVRWVTRSGADFADSEEFGVNRLGAATLDIEAGELAFDFEATDLAPGDRVVGRLEVRNAGSLPLRFAMTARGSESLLTTWLLWDAWAGTCESEPSPSDFLSHAVLLGSEPLAIVGDPATGSDIGDQHLDVDETAVVCVRAHLPLSAPNDVQGASMVFDALVLAEHDIDLEVDS